MTTRKSTKPNCLEIARAANLKGGQRVGNEVLFCCPRHNDQHPSLSVNVAKNVWICRPCSAGGNYWDLAAFIAGLDSNNRGAVREWLSARRLLNGHMPRSTFERAYVYEDENRKPLYRVERYRTPTGKTFKQSRYEKGRWIPGVKGTRPIPYRLPDWKESPSVIVIEGEKDAEALWAWKLPATNNPMGAGKWRKEFNHYFAGKRVVIIPDNDEAGEKHAIDIAHNLLPVAKSIKMVRLPNLPDKGDVSDWAAAGGTKEQLVELIKQIPPLTEKTLGEWATSIARRNKLEARAAKKVPDLQGKEITWKECSPWPEPVDGDKLLTEISNVFRRFVVASDEALVALTLFVVHSHAFTFAESSPILMLTSPEKQCGKTRALEVLDGLVAKPLFTANISAASLFRMIEKYRPTLLIDEADSFVAVKDELRGILNSGYRQGGQVIRCEGDGREPRAFSTWAPKAIAAIRNLPDTIMDRSVVIRMKRKARNEKVERLKRRTVAHLFDELARKTVRWVNDNAPFLAQAEPTFPEGLSDRAEDVWEPLLAIADAVGGSWPETARQAAKALSGLDGNRDDSIGIQLLSDLRAIFTQRSDGRLSSEEIVQALTAMEDGPWQEWKGKPISKLQISRLLKPFGIEPAQFRIAGKKIRGYEFSALLDAFYRYLSPIDSVDPVHSVHAHNDNDLEAVFESVQDKSSTDSKASPNTSKQSYVPGVPPQEAENGARELFEVFEE